MFWKTPHIQALWWKLVSRLSSPGHLWDLCPWNAIVWLLLDTRQSPGLAAQGWEPAPQALQAPGLSSDLGLLRETLIFRQLFKDPALHFLRRLMWGPHVWASCRVQNGPVMVRVWWCHFNPSRMTWGSNPAPCLDFPSVTRQLRLPGAHVSLEVVPLGTQPPRAAGRSRGGGECVQSIQRESKHSSGSSLACR